jgi:hypothetical protein
MEAQLRQSAANPAGLAIARGIAGMGGWHLSGNLLWVFGNFVLPPTGRSPCLRSCRPTNAQSGPARGGRAGDPCAVGVMGKLHTVRSVLRVVSTIEFRLALAVTAQRCCLDRSSSFEENPLEADCSDQSGAGIARGRGSALRAQPSRITAPRPTSRPRAIIAHRGQDVEGQFFLKPGRPTLATNRSVHSDAV